MDDDITVWIFIENSIGTITETVYGHRKSDTEFVFPLGSHSDGIIRKVYAAWPYDGDPRTHDIVPFIRMTKYDTFTIAWDFFLPINNLETT
jgi:hypothetical protein